MNKSRRYNKLLCTLLLALVGVVSGWAETKTMHICRLDETKDITKLYSNDKAIGTDISASGDNMNNYWVIGLFLDKNYYYGYCGTGKNFTVTFTNFRYDVTSINILADRGNTSAGTATITTIPYAGNSPSPVDIAPNWKISQEYETFAIASSLTGLKTITYQHTNGKDSPTQGEWIFLGSGSEGIFQITYEEPTISSTAKTLRKGATYTLTTNDITWEHQGAFAFSDITFSSNDESVASVSGTTITAHKVGQTTITATLKNNGEVVTTTEFTVNVNDITESNGIVTASGVWDKASLEAALAEKIDASTTNVVLTDATISDGSTIAVPTDKANPLIKANSNQVSNESNVIVGGVCNKLVLKDGQHFYATEDFKADATEYIRESTNTDATVWGAVCLPYAPVPTTDVTYYQLTAVGDNSATFQETSSTEANKPYLFKHTTSANYNANISSGNISVAATPTSLEGASAGGYTMKGAFNPTSVVDGTSYKDAKTSNYDLLTNADAYYFKNNKFNLNGGRFNMGGFRAYLAPNGTQAKAALLDCIFSDATGVQFIENKEDRTVEVIFDINGRRLNNKQKGINIINGKKIIVK